MFEEDDQVRQHLKTSIVRRAVTLSPNRLQVHVAARYRSADTSFTVANAMGTRMPDLMSGYAPLTGLTKVWVTRVDGEAPGETAVGAAVVVPAWSGRLPYAWETVDMSGAGIYLEAGQRYALVLTGTEKDVNVPFMDFPFVWTGDGNPSGLPLPG